MTRIEDRIWDELAEQHGTLLADEGFSPDVRYKAGDIVIRSEPVKRSLWQWLTRQPVREVDREYIYVGERIAGRAGRQLWEPTR